MASSTQSDPKISLKLMIHREKKKVIFAEANGHFVDALFSFMTLPLGTIVRLLAKQPDEKQKPLVSLQNIYKSLIDLSDDYFSAEECKFVLLNPKSSSYGLCRKLKLNIDDTEPTKYYLCSKIHFNDYFFGTSNITSCPSCGYLMNRELSTNDPAAGVDYNVFVSNLISFIVTDDLRVMPNDASFVMQLFCEHGITDVRHIEEMTLHIGLEQVSILLNMALKVKYPLTYLVFSPTNIIQELHYPTKGFSVQDFVSNNIDTCSKRMILNVTLQKSTSRFLFAEAGSEFVEFLFSFMEIPLGTVIGKLFSGTSSLECVDNLYASISNINVGEGIKSQNLKDMLLHPQALKYVCTNQIFPLVDATTVSSGQQSYKYLHEKGSYLKSPAKFMLTDDLVITPLSSASTVAVLSRLKISLNDIETHKVDIGIEEALKYACTNQIFPLVDATTVSFGQRSYEYSRAKESYLKSPAKFMLTDDLVITPLSPTSTVAVLSRLKISLNDMETHKVDIGIEEGLKILHASLNSVTTLTDSLLQKIVETKKQSVFWCKS